jgi:hypothetical protein
VCAIKVLSFKILTVVVFQVAPKWTEYKEMKRSKTVTFKFDIFHSDAVSALRKYASSVRQTLNINLMHKVDRLG